jgi:hypothetical protein
MCGLARPYYDLTRWAGVGGDAGQLRTKHRADGPGSQTRRSTGYTGNGLMKIRKVPASWLDAPRKETSTPAGKRRGTKAEKLRPAAI